VTKGELGQLEHLLEYPKQFSNPGILVRLKKTHLQLLPNPHPNLLALGKTHPHTRKVMRAYRHANLEVEGRGEENKYDRVPDANVQERNKV